jgi:hypothetical protein
LGWGFPETPIVGFVKILFICFLAFQKFFVSRPSQKGLAGGLGGCQRHSHEKFAPKVTGASLSPGWHGLRMSSRGVEAAYYKQVTTCGVSSDLLSSFPCRSLPF